MATENNATAVADPQPAKTVVHPEDMTEKQRSRWLLDGTHPEIKPKAAASATAPKDGEKKADPPPAEEQATHKRNGEDRKAQLAAEIKQLLEDRATIRQEIEKAKEKPAESQTAKPETQQLNAPKPPERPKRPDITQFKTTAEYDTAMDKYDADVDTYNAQKAAFDKATADAKESQEKLEKNLLQGVARVKEKYPEAIEKSKPLFLALQENAQAMPQVTWFLNNTTVLPDMLYVLSDKFKLDEFLALGKNDPAKAIRVLVSMENAILDELEKAAKPKEEAEKAESLEDEKPVPREPKRVTDAPPPPREVGGKASVTDDPVKSAVARRDFGSFRETANQRDIQRRKERGR